MTQRFDPPGGDAAPPYDIETLDDLAGLFGPERFARMLAELDAEIERRLGSAAADDPGLGAQAHVLVSVSGTMGFTPLSTACAGLEQACLDGGDVAGPLARAKEAGSRARQAIARLRAEV